MEEPGQLKRAFIDAAAGAIAGGISRTVTSPLDVIKIRFQVNFGLGFLSDCRSLFWIGFLNSIVSLYIVELCNLKGSIQNLAFCCLFDYA